MVWNFACWCILGTFKTDLIMVMVCWYSSFWCHFDLVRRVKFGVSGHFPENASWEWPEFLHADVSWPPSKLISLWSWAVDFYNFGVFFLSEMGQIWGFRAFPGEPFFSNGLKFCMLMYLEHIQNWLDFGRSLMILLILALIWLSETGQIWGFQAFSGECMEGIAWNFACGCTLTTFTTD